MQLTVIICTWNRCRLLKRALEQMTKLIVPEEMKWELLIVNNNSTDNTDSVIQDFYGLLPIRRLFEAVPGKSSALNFAVREAVGEYILFTDDDVLVDAHWLNAYCDAFKAWPYSAIFGGKIEPLYEGNPPAWLVKAENQIEGVYAIRDLSSGPIPLDEKLFPWGANYAIRRKEHLNYFYDTRLGPRPNSCLKGEETDLIKRMLKDKIKGYWVPEATVKHFIPKERQTIHYLRSYYYHQGECYSITEREPLDSVLLFGKPRWLWKKAILDEIQYGYHRLLSPPEKWIKYLKDSAIAWGFLRYWKKIR